MIVTAGSTNRSVAFYIVGDAGHATPGEPITGLLYSDIETGGSASYARQGAARVDLTLITLASASAAHADGGFILVDDTEMPGVYRCDFPDAAFATGVDEVVLALRVTALKNAVAAPLKVQIYDVDLRDAVRGGMSALPDAAADGAGGLPISDTGGLDLDGMDTAVAAIPTTAMRGTDSAALASIATEARLAELDGANLPTDVAAIPTTAMRGTDNAALASIATEARLAELDGANLPTDIAAIPTTEMRGTDNAALASVATETRLAELDAANLPTDVAAIPTTAMRGTDSAALASTVGAAGAGLTDLGGMSTGMKAEVNAEADTALSDMGFAAPRKNAIFSDVSVFMVDSTDHVTPKTGLSLTVTRSIDGGAFGSGTGTAAEIGNGMYQYDASADDMNGDLIIFRFTGTAADDTFISVKTRA